MYVKGEDLAQGQGLYSVPVNGGPPVRLSTVQSGFADRFQISPNSEYVVFIDGLETLSGALARIPIDGGETKVLADVTHQRIGYFKFSPDSSLIAFRTESKLYSIKLSGEDVTRLNEKLPRTLDTSDHHVDEFEFTPDSRRVVFAGNLEQDFAESIYCVAATGGIVTRHSTQWNAVHLVGEPSALIPSNDGVVYRGEASPGASNLYKAFFTDEATVEILDNDFGAPKIWGPTGRLADRRPTISWSSVAEAERYEVLLEAAGTQTEPIAHRTVSSTSFSVIDDLNIGRYLVRIRAIGEAGNVSNWATHNFSIVDTPVIHQPPFQVNTEPLQITWDAVDGAGQYRIYINNVTTSQFKIVDEIVNGTSWSSESPLRFGAHRAWVQAISHNGFHAGWSRAVEFNNGPRPLSPVASVTDSAPVFTWTPAAGADSYQLYVRQGNNVVIDQLGISDTSFEPNETLPEGDYRWWVRASTLDGRAGAWSNAGSFHHTWRPTILSPEAATSVDTIDVEWGAVTGAQSYEVYLYSNTTSQLVHRQSDLKLNQFSSVPIPDGDYRVWVRSHNSDDVASAWSTASAFTLSAADVEFQTDAISSETSSFETRPELFWTENPNAVAYDLYLTDGVSVIQRDNLSSSSWISASPMSPERWTWWVRVKTARGEAGPWSSPAIVDLSGRAVLLAPTGQFTDRTPTFSWKPVVGADRYVLQVDRDSTSTRAVIREDYLTSTQWTANSDLAPGYYRFWVRAVTGNRYGSWSMAGKFFITRET